MKVHELKILQDYADAVFEGSKTFEIRYNDRGYQAGDAILFVVMTRIGKYVLANHPLQGKCYEITYVHSGLGMAEGYVALGIKPKGADA